MSDESSRPQIAQALVNALEAERYVRGALLLELLDELETSPIFDDAVVLARALLARVELRDLDDAEFVRRVGVLRQMIHYAVDPPEESKPGIASVVTAARTASAA